MGYIEIASGHLNVAESRKYINTSIFNTSISLYLTDSEIQYYSVIITNVEIFGKRWWENYKLKFLDIGNPQIIFDNHLKITIDSNIDWWTRDKILENILESEKI